MRYAYRLETMRIKEPMFPYHGKQLNCTANVIQFAKSLKSSDIEKLIVCYLNSQNILLGIYIASGTLNQSTIYVREVVRHALLWSAVSIILLHNHPSNNPLPSGPDIRLTKEIIECTKIFDLTVHDHLIITESSHYSFREEGII